MNVVLWILQGVLAAAFLMAGLMKVTQPKEKLADRMKFVNDYSDGMVKFIGAVEVLGAIGLILPAATGIAPVLTPVAATGLALTMAGAASYHIRKKDIVNEILPSVVLLVLAAVVAWGRFGPYSL
ncbi:DoxX family protein [Streptomyces sp. H10-C2]|uniref:DoxX family protein n=1 Tax=unclassified Streptomyces TaxID=2593676 RepID=UPI0024BB0278|nr:MULTISPECIES: DoxX family protein [unclassified Streptomyces]MDJ0345814.1 DoxX family protein [Streptomyces sp. PH10-H1]MDJ0374704.1 DoxX family protein [Streptomyces sp. H10-C2]